MDQDRPFRRIPDILQHGEQVVQVMAVDRADIIEAKLLEQRAARRQSAREFIGLARGDMQRARHPPGDLAQPFAHGNEGAGRDQRSEEHTSELQSLLRISYSGFALEKKKTK